MNGRAKIDKSFAIGQVDQAAKFVFPRSTIHSNVHWLTIDIYGRDEQMNLLMESFREVQLTGNSGVCLVSGYAGAGKTYLVKKAMDRMIREGALTTYAKYDQYADDVPYLAMVNLY